MILSWIFYTLIISIISLFFINCKKAEKIISLTGSASIFILSLLLLYNFDSNETSFQFITKHITFTFGIDGISLFFFLLSSLLIFLCILFIWEDKFFKQYSLNLLVIELFLLIIFSTLNLFIFYVFFEAILIPMYLIIGVWGSRGRKIRAGYLFFFYTFISSILMLISILVIYLNIGTLDFQYVLANIHKFDIYSGRFLWICFFLSFSSKIPMFPFHIWLPEAHVEAPTVGSVLLAGILLKLGVYGFIRYSITLFPEASMFYSPLIFLLSSLGVIYASMTAIRQTDFKRIIAYSSIAHMNLVTLGIFSFNTFGIEGALLQSISHGFVSGGMFFLIGILYNRYHSRSIYYYGGLVHLMPLYTILFFIFTLANIALPGTSSFIGEFAILSGLYKMNIIVCSISALGIILCGIYSLWLYNRVIFGNIKNNFNLIFKDINTNEFLILLPLLFLIFLMGVYPTFFTSFLHFNCNFLFLIGN